jgi:lipopolysaccharide transport system ATP-binding protein
MRGRVSSLLEVGTGFHPELTGRENIFLNGAILGMTRQEIKGKFDEIVAFAEVEKFLDTPVKRFSSGMYTRLGFAVAAHLDPDLFIVDEVLAVGDSQFQEKCLKKLNDLGSNGRTVLFVSHDVGSVLTLCNKGIFLEKGRVQECGPIDECVNSYMRKCREQSLCWQGNEGDENIRFYRATLISDHSDREFFYQNEKAQIEIEYEILKPTPDLIIGVGVWNQRNQLIARSHTSDDRINFRRFNQPGRHIASFLIDAELFHEGEYFIKLDCNIHDKKRVLNEDIALKFSVYAPQKNTRYTHAIERDGIFLGNRWKISSQQE